MDDTQTDTKKSEAPSAFDAMVKRFAEELVAERVSSGHINLKTASFRTIEQLSHDIGKRVAQQLGQQFTGQQCGELYSDDYNCPVCGLECEAIKHPRIVETVDGPAEIIELKSFCPQCRRNFFPCAEHHGA